MELYNIIKFICHMRLFCKYMLFEKQTAIVEKHVNSGVGMHARLEQLRNENSHPILLNYTYFVTYRHFY